MLVADLGLLYGRVQHPALHNSPGVPVLNVCPDMEFLNDWFGRDFVQNLIPLFGSSVHRTDNQ